MRSKTTMTLFLIISLCFAGNAAGLEANVGSSTITWDAVSGSQLVLVVSGPEGYHLRQEFAAGSAPSFDIFGDDGQYLAAGTYTWELVGSPVKGAKRSEKISLLEGVRASGSFSIAGNAFVSPDVPENVDKDQVFLDDLIVEGSACVGLDCANGESFGFDTLKLKENNLRIKFEDTSSSASFPGNDWQLLANESDNGGLNKFSIVDTTNNKTPFTVEANTPNNALYIDDTGNIGIGTNTPNSIELYIKDGDSPTLRLEQDGSSGFQSQSWDVAGNETNFFVRDVTNGSKLPFKIIPDAPTNSLYVDSDGSIGLGTANPGDDLHVRRTSGNAALRLQTTEADGTAWILRSQTTGQMQWRDNGAGTIPVRIGPGAQNNLLNIGMSADGNTADPDRINITGELYINGADNSTPDYVFESDYELISIEEQAEYMWTNKHLPSVPKAELGEDGKTKFSMVDRAQGVLEELEKAHIYIEQLHKRLAALEAAQEAAE